MSAIYSIFALFRERLEAGRRSSIKSGVNQNFKRGFVKITQRMDRQSPNTFPLQPTHTFHTMLHWWSADFTPHHSPLRRAFPFQVVSRGALRLEKPFYFISLNFANELAPQTFSPFPPLERINLTNNGEGKAGNCIGGNLLIRQWSKKSLPRRERRQKKFARELWLFSFLNCVKRKVSFWLRGEERSSETF